MQTERERGCSKNKQSYYLNAVSFTNPNTLTNTNTNTINYTNTNIKRVANKRE